jgi:hypothetical protein
LHFFQGQGCWPFFHVYFPLVLLLGIFFSVHLSIYLVGCWFFRR